jgi:hypothetical protein
MCDVRQLAWRPIRPEGQQLLTADLREWEEDPGRGIRKGSGRRKIRRTMLTILLPPPPFSVISDKNTLIL